MNSPLSTYVPVNMGWKEMVVSQNLISILIRILSRNHLDNEPISTNLQMVPAMHVGVWNVSLHIYIGLTYTEPNDD